MVFELQSSAAAGLHQPLELERRLCEGGALSEVEAEWVAPVEIVGGVDPSGDRRIHPPDLPAVEGMTEKLRRERNGNEPPIAPAIARGGVVRQNDDWRQGGVRHAW